MTRVRDAGGGSSSAAQGSRAPRPRACASSGAPALSAAAGLAGRPTAVRVQGVRQHNYRTRSLELDLEMTAEPGQFAMPWLPGLDEQPFSLMGDAPVLFCVAAVGPFSRALHQLSAGDRVWVRGPFGTGFRPRGRRHLLVGGGYGVAPLLFLAKRCAARSDALRAVVGARVAEELLLVDLLRAAGADVQPCTEDGSIGLRGLATDAVARLVEAERPDAVYACGPHRMLEVVQDFCRAQALPAQLSWEAYMRCGIGVCGSCAHGDRVLCTDGPVLEYEP